jgi:mono/diheme cytochrome c family protein
MKKIFVLAFSTVLMTGLYNCKSSKNTVSSTENRTLVAAQKRWPDATLTTINSGHAIYTTKCAQCHGAKEITDYTEEAWKPILDNMAKKARLTEEEKETVRRYILANLDVAKAKRS